MQSNRHDNVVIQRRESDGWKSVAFDALVPGDVMRMCRAASGRVWADEEGYEEFKVVDKPGIYEDSCGQTGVHVVPAT